MFVGRNTRSGGQKWITQHVSGGGIVQSLGGMREIIPFEPYQNRFAHFRRGPQMIVTSGDQQHRPSHIFYANRSLLDRQTIAQASAEKIPKQHGPLHGGDGKRGAQHETAKWERRKGNGLASARPAGNKFAGGFVASAGSPRNAARRIGHHGANVRR